MAWYTFRRMPYSRWIWRYFRGIDKTQWLSYNWRWCLIYLNMFLLFFSFIYPLDSVEFCLFDFCLRFVSLVTFWYHYFGWRGVVVAFVICYLSSVVASLVLFIFIFVLQLSSFRSVCMTFSIYFKRLLQFVVSIWFKKMQESI